jgi:hypothetical protein
MEFHAGIYKTKYYGQFMTVLLVFFVVILLLLNAFAVLAIIIAIVMILAFRISQRSITFKNSIFIYKGWIKSEIISYQEILKVESSSQVGYPADRLHGPLEYRISTNEKTFWVSFLWFGTDAFRKFQEDLCKQNKKA